MMGSTPAGPDISCSWRWKCVNGASPSSSSMGAMKSTWNGIWKLEVPKSLYGSSLLPNKFVATNSVSSFLDVIQLAQQDRSHFALFAWTTSLIWMRRNKLRLEEDTVPLAMISSMACEGLQEYQQLRPIHTKIPGTARSVRWRPLPTGLLKVNFDGTLFAEEVHGWSWYYNR